MWQQGLVVRRRDGREGSKRRVNKYDVREKCEMTEVDYIFFYKQKTAYEIGL